jgi:hypothetical protein
VRRRGSLRDVGRRQRWPYLVTSVIRWHAPTEKTSSLSYYKRVSGNGSESDFGTATVVAGRQAVVLIAAILRVIDARSSLALLLSRVIGALLMCHTVVMRHEQIQQN